MNWDQIKGNWKLMTGTVKERWGMATNNDRTITAGQRDQLLGKLQTGYGDGKEKVKKDVDKLIDSL